MNELAILKSVDFDWALQLRNVWSDSIPHVPELHQDTREEFLEAVDRLVQSENSSSPLGKVIYGMPGSGKTHLLGSIRRETFQKKQWFILADLLDVRDFEEAVLLGFIESLQRDYGEGRLQYEAVLDRFLERLGFSTISLTSLSRLSEKELIKITTQLINRLRTKQPIDMQRHQDVFRALIYFHSQNPALSDVGYSYLFCFNSEEEQYGKYGFMRNPQYYTDIIKSLSWIMSIGGMTVLALDQLDAIVTQQHLASGTGDELNLNNEQKKSLAIIEGIARGLSSLREQTSRSLIVLTCLPRTWDILIKKALQANTDRYERPIVLKDVNVSAIAETIIRQRLDPAYRKHNFIPPYPTWPFKAESFNTLLGKTPRDILKCCDQCRREWIHKGKVLEIESFDHSIKVEKPILVEDQFKELNHTFESLKNSPFSDNFLEESEEDNRLGNILQNGYRFLLKEISIPDSIDAVLDCDFPSGKQYPPLHARLRLVHRTENDREEHYCVRALLRSNASSYRARLKAAMAASGIDRDLSFRCLRLIRDKDAPSGNVTQQLTQEFYEHQGKFIKPSPADLHTISNLMDLEKKFPADFCPWLEYKTPMSSLSLMEDAVAWLKEKIPATTKPERQKIETPPVESNPPSSLPAASIPMPQPKLPSLPLSTNKRIPIGNRWIGGQLQEEIQLDLISLTKHTVILAGTGSGKTVLMKRLIEEAALVGIPSIVIDAANDLVRLGQPWPQAHPDWKEEDASKAERYFQSVETIVWTPNRETGNPLYLSPLPDFSAVKNNSDELNQAIILARDALLETVASGASANAQKKSGILSESLRYFANRTCGSLEDFIELLSDLPPEAGAGITNSQKFALEMADQLRAAIASNPLMKAANRPLDPKILLSTPSGKTRISVINFIGLPSMESQQEFTNQLAMALFTWIKKNPASAEKPLQGLFVIDEAKDYAPSGKSTPCKESLIHLAAQARKYGLGLIFATQAPKSIDHNIVANCANHFYGQANSPAAIQTIEELIRQKGGSGLDVSKLGAGYFYVYSDKINGVPPKAPVKFKAPICLSHHPHSPMDENGVLECAQRSMKLIRR